MKLFLHSISLGWTVAAVIVLVIAAHLEVAFFSRHIALTASFVSVFLVLFLALHLGLIGPVYALFRRRLKK